MFNISPWASQGLLLIKQSLNESNSKSNRRHSKKDWDFHRKHNYIMICYTLAESPNLVIWLFFLQTYQIFARVRKSLQLNSNNSLTKPNLTKL